MVSLHNINKHNVILAVIHGCTKNGMIAYPDMLMLGRTTSNVWTLPVFSLMHEFTDPFYVMTIGMEKEYAVRVARMKYIFTKEVVNTKNNVLSTVVMHYYEVRTNGHLRKKAEKYTHTQFWNYDHLENLQRTSVGLNHWLTEVKRRRSLENENRSKRVQNALKHLNHRLLTGAAHNLGGLPQHSMAAGFANIAGMGMGGLDPLTKLPLNDWDMGDF